MPVAGELAHVGGTGIDTRILQYVYFALGVFIFFLVELLSSLICVCLLGVLLSFLNTKIKARSQCGCHF